jgi:putative ABC transport system permease protein
MKQLRAWLRRLAATMAFVNRHERDMDAELASHLQMHIDDNIRAGMSPDEARRDALIRLGGLEQVKELYRSRRRIPFLQHIAQDLRFSVRVLRKSPTFSAAAIITLALGIGVNAAIFSVVHAVLLTPLPFPRADRLMLLWATNTKSGDREDVASYPDFETWKAQSSSFDAMGAFTSRGVTLSGGARPELVPSIQVTPGFFEMLDVQVAAGRSFVAGDDVPGAPPVALLSDSGWKELFGGRPDVVGRTISANEQLRTIVGILPPGFRFSPLEQEQIYLPIAREGNRNHGYLRVVGRLKAGIDPGSAQAEMSLLANRIAVQYPKSNANVGVNVVPLLDALVGHELRLGLLVFLGVVALVLLIACTNVANLMLARNASRERELSLRLALGAGRWRVFQQLLTESLVLALTGGMFGLLLAYFSTQLLVALLSGGIEIPRVQQTRIDAWVLLFTLAVSSLTGILFGVVPAMCGSPVDLNASLRESPRAVSEGSRGRRARAILIIAETALALVLLAGAGLLLKTLATWRGTSPGFTTENLVVADLWLPDRKFAVQEARSRFLLEVRVRLQTMRVVASTGFVADLPLNGGSDSLGFRVLGRSTNKQLSALFNVVSPDYFKTIGIPIRAGRDFAATDTAGSPGVVVINESAARRFWPDENPLGQQITVDGDRPLTVVGVVGDVRQSSLGSVPRAEIFLNALQPGPDWPSMTLVVRTTTEPALIAGLLKDLISSVDSEVPVIRVRSLEDVLASTLARPRAFTTLLALFAFLAVLLAAVGLYGVVSYSVSQRKHELGIRLALGATRADVVRLVLKQGTVYAALGALLGVGGAVAFMRVLTTVMPGAPPRDLALVAEVSLVLLLVALAASYLPARRGSHLDPVVALRSE